MFTFSGGVATIWRDTLFDFNDGDFSFLANITPKDVSKHAVISEKSGSWRLSVENSKLKLEMYAEDPRQADPVILTAPIEANKKYHVGFKVFGFRDSGSTVRLYLNGRSVAEFSDASVPDGKSGTEQVQSVG